jgi:cobalt-zinc-cadmium efflux system membrane fusion protein
MKHHFSPLLLALSVSCTNGCGAKAIEEPAVRPRSTSGRVTLTKEQVQAAKLVIQSVEEREVGETVNTSGKVAFDDLLVAHVFSPVTGRVTKIIAQPGARMKKGAPLAMIESPDLGQAYADLGKAQADLVAAQHEYNRQKDLFEAHAGPKKDFETAEDNYHKALAELERAKQKAKLLRSDQVDKATQGQGVTQEYTLRSPIDGEVIARNINPAIEITGQYSGGNAPELFTVGELDRVLVYADLFDQDLARAKEGAKVFVKVAAYPERTFEGTVEWVSDALDPATRTAKVRCRLDNADHALKPEMYATVQIAAPGRKAPAIPRAAVLRLGDQTVVFVQTAAEADGQVKFERRLVAVDEDQGTEFVPVLKNLEPGEQVVASGAVLLSEMN